VGEFAGDDDVLLRALLEAENAVEDLSGGVRILGVKKSTSRNSSLDDSNNANNADAVTVGVPVGDNDSNNNNKYNESNNIKNDGVGVNSGNNYTGANPNLNDICAINGARYDAFFKSGLKGIGLSEGGFFADVEIPGLRRSTPRALSSQRSTPRALSDSRGATSPRFPLTLDEKLRQGGNSERVFVRGNLCSVCKGQLSPRARSEDSNRSRRERSLNIDTSPRSTTASNYNGSTTASNYNTAATNTPLQASLPRPFPSRGRAMSPSSLSNPGLAANKKYPTLSPARSVALRRRLAEAEKLCKSQQQELKLIAEGGLSMRERKAAELERVRQKLNR